MRNSSSDTLQNTHWWWLRHAPTGRKGCMVGSWDVDAILPSAESLSHITQALPKDADWLVSPLGRCQQTATALSAKNITTIDDLREQNFGAWEGISYDEPSIRHAKSFWDDPGNVAPPEGESFADMSKRVQTAILKQPYSNHKIVVAHAGVIRAAVSLALDLTTDQALRLQVAPLSLTRITWFSDPENPAGVWSVHSLNQQIPLSKQG